MEENDITGDIYRYQKNGRLYKVIYSGMGVVKSISELIVVCQCLSNSHALVLSTHELFDGSFQYEGKIHP